MVRISVAPSHPLGVLLESLTENDADCLIAEIDASGVSTRRLRRAEQDATVRPPTGTTAMRLTIKFKDLLAHHKPAVSTCLWSHGGLAVDVDGD
jgi:hypothetical protein